MDLAGKKVSVFGMGKSGVSAIKLLNRMGAEIRAISAGDVGYWKNLDEVLSIVDRNKCYCQDDASSVFAESDLIILSPGIPREHEVLEKAIERGVLIWSEIELAYSMVREEIPIIAVTGTNGKTTTVTMIGEMIKNAGFDVFVGGNIGIPFCDYVLDGGVPKFIVLELSSFQLESMETFRPHVAILLNVFPNHGERYAGIDDYRLAKFNISNNMTENDTVIYPANDMYALEWAKKLKTKLVPIYADDPYEAKRIIEERFDLKNFKLQGGHNITNLLFAISALDQFDINPAGIQKTIDSFCGVDFRVQYIESDDSFVAYNDAKSTNWDAVKTAINAIDKNGRKLHLILGGQRRGKGDTLIPHFEVIKKTDKIILIGETTDQFAKEIDGIFDYIKCYDLETAINYERENLFNGILLFSPGLPSYDQYENYIKRGEHFTKLIKEL